MGILWESSLATSLRNADNLTDFSFHIHHGCLDAFLPILAELRRIFRFPVSINHASAGRNKSPASIPESQAGHLGRRPLRAVSGQQENRFRQLAAKALHRMWL